jgi:hypothetical protein
MKESDQPIKTSDPLAALNATPDWQACSKGLGKGETIIKIQQF